jgi:predicted metal-dependent HD superfamily phosphohydrolase
MTSPDVVLRRAWRSIVGLGHDGVVEMILARHREAHRRYHTAVHVMYVIEHIAELERAGEPITDPAAVRVAALFHDIVYDPRSSTNEADSARLAASEMTAVGWATDRCAHIARLIEATAGHDPSGADQAILLDADLAVLGADPAVYQAYVNGVRAEYAHVDDDAWRVGRAAVLRHFLDRPTIFATPTMHADRERRARANLTAEIAALSSEC